jgi:signal transduction histidine kinase
MKPGWRHSLRLRLAFWNAAAGAVLWLAGLEVMVLSGFWRPANLSDWFLPLLAGCPCGAIVLGIASWFIAGAILKPLDEMAVQARGLSAGALRERLPVANPHDELGQLAAAFNEILQQLETSFAELDRLTADVSHELRTPLTAMRAVGEVALRERNPAILHDAVGSMLEEIARMNQLLDRLLLLTRADNDEMPLQLRQGMVRKALLEVSETLSLVAEEKQQRLLVTCADALPAVFDPALLRLALMNLTQNAIRYSPAGKSIILRAAAVDGSILIEVADQGCGIAPEHQQKIFERFYRVDKARSRAEGGVGLGLAIVKWSVERMGGTVELDSAIGHGSVFRIRLRTPGV